MGVPSDISNTKITVSIGVMFFLCGIAWGASKFYDDIKDEKTDRITQDEVLTTSIETLSGRGDKRYDRLVKRIENLEAYTRELEEEIYVLRKCN